MKKGDIVLIPFPFTDLTGSKTRPAIVLASNLEDVTVNFITTKTKWKDEFDVELFPTKRNGLKQLSIIRVNKIATLETSLVLGRLGVLDIDETGKHNTALLKMLQLE